EAIEWGARALVSELSRQDHKKNLPKPIELFKLLLGDVPEDQKPKLPSVFLLKELSSTIFARW
ncbi:12302_t:CDS:1, partial [Cetraspora pellucida]